MGLFISFIYRLICSPFAEALQVHVNPHFHVYAAFCVYKIYLAYNLRNGRNYVGNSSRASFFAIHQNLCDKSFFLGMMSSRTPFYHKRPVEWKQAVDSKFRKVFLTHSLFMLMRELVNAYSSEFSQWADTLSNSGVKTHHQTPMTCTHYMGKSTGTPPSLEQKKALPNLWQQRWEHNSCI